MATSRIDMRVDESVKAAAEKAAALKGMNSMTGYVVRLIEQDAQRVIKEHESCHLSRAFSVGNGPVLEPSATNAALISPGS